TKAIYDRVSEGPGAHEVRGLCIDLFTTLYVRYNHAICREIIFCLMAYLFLNPDDIQRIPPHLRAPLTYSPLHPHDPIQSSVRHLAFDLIARLLQTAHHEFDDVQAAHLEVPFNAWPVTDQKNAQILARLIDDIGMQLYFASGAYGAKTQGGRMPLSS